MIRSLPPIFICCTLLLLSLSHTHGSFASTAPLTSPPQLSLLRGDNNDATRTFLPSTSLSALSTTPSLTPSLTSSSTSSSTSSLTSSPLPTSELDEICQHRAEMFNVVARARVQLTLDLFFAVLDVAVLPLGGTLLGIVRDQLLCSVSCVV